MSNTKDNSTDLRCKHCKRKLAVGLVIKLSIKCPRCGTVSIFERHERL